MPTAERRLTGQRSSGPSGVPAQSNARTRAAIWDSPSHRGAAPLSIVLGVEPLAGRDPGVGEIEQRRADAAAPELAVAERELGEDAVDVLLDGPLGERQTVRDGGVAVALGDERERLDLPL